MAKRKLQQRVSRRRRQPRRVVPRGITMPSGELSRQTQYAQLLSDPDNGKLLLDGVYDGELGNIQRFTSTLTANTTTGHTCGYCVFCPRTGNGFIASTTTSNTAISFSVTNSGFPGASFLLANAARTRGIAAKLELIPSSFSWSEMTGEVCAGIGSNINFVTATTTVDHLFDVAKAYGPLTKKTVTSRWFPSGMDHVYETYNSAFNDESNIVFIAWRNVVAAKAVPVRISYVVEYTLRNTIGIPLNASTSNPVGHNVVLRALQDHDPHWHHNILDEIKSLGKGVTADLGVFARHMVRKGLSDLGSAMFKIGPKALPMLLA